MAKAKKVKEVAKEPVVEKPEAPEAPEVPEVPEFPYKKKMNGFSINVIEELPDGTLKADDGCTYRV